MEKILPPLREKGSIPLRTQGGHKGVVTFSWGVACLFY